MSMTYFINNYTFIICHQLLKSYDTLKGGMHMSGYGYTNIYATILVLFILLVIIGCTCYRY